MVADVMGGQSPQPIDLADELVGQILRGTYRMTAVLDHGGMGMVFAAEHVRLRRRVAVKVLAQHLATDAHALARFHREAEIISRLVHPHIVQVLDYDTTEAGAPYLVMELLEGESLAARLSRENKLAPGEVVRIAAHVASALSAAHGASIVHRDLKPANIFLIEVPGSSAFVKLLDFGISKQASASGITGEFDILGTPDYMAPEQALGRTASVDHRADQYSLAAIMYESLTGRVPFVGNDLGSVLSQVINDVPAPPTQLNPELPSAIDAVLARALSKQPEHRYKDVLEFVAAAAAALDAALPTGHSHPPISRSNLIAQRPRDPATADDSDLQQTLPRAIQSLAPPPAQTAAVQVQPPGDPSRSRSPVDGRYRGSDAPAESERVAPPPAHSVSATPRPSQFSQTVHDSHPRATAEPRSQLPAAPIPFTLGTDAEQRIVGAINEARMAFGFEDLELAVTHAETALGLAERHGGVADEALKRAATLFELIFERYTGRTERKMRVRRVPDRATPSALSPSQVYMLSGFEQGLTVQEALDVSPLSRTESLRIIVQLLRKGILEPG